ncbi:MAG: hypothetical protein AAF600_17065 [Bacteroidota bacterium]
MNEEIEKTLASLDHVKKATLGSDFDKKVAQKIAFLPKYSTTRWLKFIAAAMLLMALINGILLMNSYSNHLDIEADLSSHMLYQAMDYTEFE